MKSKITTSNKLYKNQRHLKNDELFYNKICSDELLLSLNFSYRDITIIKLRCNDNRTFDKIAYEVGLSPERVRVLYSRMKSKIIAALSVGNNCIDKKNLTSNLFNTKLVNILKQKGIHTLEDIAGYTKKDLTHFNQIGGNTIELIEQTLQENGLRFAE